MISLDQLIFFIDFHQIGREMKNSRRDKYLFNSVYLSDKMIRTAFYLSKMTVSDEMHSGMMEFVHLKLVEFMEFIGRLSHAFFESTSHHFEWKITQKIEVVLGWMLKVIGCEL